jgi:anti-sigma regulatory factor (Ser/Thr protein kinase)
MVTPTLSVDGTVDPIQAASVSVESTHPYVRSLKKLHDREERGMGTEKGNARLLNSVSFRWQQLGIADFVRTQIDRLAPGTSGSTLPLLAKEWTMNAVEHGAHFEGIVSVEAVASDEEVRVRITDPGPGIDPRRISGPDAHYVSSKGMKRGYGLQGAIDARDVDVSFEKDERGFTVILRTSRSLIMRRLAERESVR